jgi:putative transposase
LALTAAAHYEQLRGDERIGYHALYEIPGQLSIDDLAPSVDVAPDGEVSA